MDKLILAIETSIKNGSLSLLDGTDEIDVWIGDNSTSRSEDLLPQIVNLLNRNGILLSQLSKIAVSTGPGSFTGLRVGLATAKALRLASDCQLAGIPLLAAIAGNYNVYDGKKENYDSKEEGNSVVVVSAGRETFFWQLFRGANALSDLVVTDRQALECDLNRKKVSRVLIEPVAYADYRKVKNEAQVEFEVVEGNFAKMIGMQAARNEFTDLQVEPLYIRPAVVKAN